MKGDNIKRVGHILLLSAVTLYAGCGDKAAKPNAKEKDHTSPSGLTKPETVQLGAMEMLKKLVENNPEAARAGKSHNSHTPLLDAVEAGQIETVRVLLDAGVDIEASKRDGVTPLHAAVRGGYIDIAALLLTEGANPNPTDQRGATPLHYAALRNSAPLTNLLLEHGAVPGAERLEGLTAKRSAHDQETPNDAGKNALIQPPQNTADNGDKKQQAGKPSRTEDRASAATSVLTHDPTPQPVAQPAPDETVSLVGKTLHEVTQSLGRPKMRGKHGKKVILVYDGRRISASDGITVDTDSDH